MGSVALPAGPLYDDRVSPPSAPPSTPALSAGLTFLDSVLDGCVVSISQSPMLRSLDNGAGVCVTCGRGAGGLTLHRLKHDGLVQDHCSSCILFYNKGMYCSQCFQVYRDASQVGDPSLWLTCCKCQRLSHLECVRNLGSSAGSLDSSFFICKDCCNPSSCREVRGNNLMNGAYTATTADERGLLCKASAEALPPSDEALRPNGRFEDMSESSVGAATGLGDVAACKSSGCAQVSNGFSQNSLVLDQEAVAAANIVAALAANEAKDAKAKAKVLAVAAVKAAARAKAALDAAYRAGRDEAKWRVEALRNLPTVAGPHPVQFVGTSNSVGANSLEKRKLEIVVGVDYQPGQFSRVPADEEELATHMSNVAGASRSPRTAAPGLKKRSLSSIAASEAMQAPFSSCGDFRQGAAFLKQQQQSRSQIGSLTEVRQYRPLSSVHEVPYQLREDSHTVPFVGSEGLAVSGSPASILDGAGTSRLCSLASHSDTDVGFPEMHTVADGLCSTFVPGNGLVGTQISVSVNDSVALRRGDFTTNDCDPLPRQMIGSSMDDTPDGKMTYQANIKEMKTYSHGTGEASPDDLVDLGTILPRMCEEEAKLSNGFVAVEGAYALHGFSTESACVEEETRERVAESVVLASSEKNARPGVVNHQLSPQEQPNGTKLAAEQGKHVYDESSLLANKAFLQKNQRSMLLHTSASNHGEKSVPYSMATGSVSTACSVPLQTTALTSVPTGPHS